MYRHLFKKQCRMTACALSYVKHACDSRTRHQAPYFTTTRTCVNRRHVQVTFCQWQYWRKLAGAQNEIVSYVTVSHRWSSGVAKCTHSESTQSVADIFEQYNALLESNSLTPERIIHFTTALRSAVYSSLAWLPWLHNDNHIIAFMQILMNSKIEELLRKPLYSQKYFVRICQHMEQLTDQLPKQDCPSILLSLLYSGVDRTEPLVHKLLARCHSATSDLQIQHLRDLTHILQTLGGRDFVLVEKILSQLDHILSGNIHDVDFEVADLCVCHPVLAVFMSQNLLEKTALAVLKKLQQKSSQLDILTIGCCFRYARKMKFRVSGDTLEIIRMLGKKSLDSLEDCRQLQSYHIAEICHNARNLGCFSGDIVDKVQARSLQLLRENGSRLHIRDVTNLLFAFSKTADPELKQEVSQLLLKHLDDADVLTLSNIADNILDLGLQDPDLISLFQSKVMQNIDYITQYITRLVKILRLLRERRDCDSRFNQELSSVLLKSLSQQQGYDPTLVVVVAQFVLPNVRTVVPAVLMEALLYAIPRCNLSLILMVLSSLDKIDSPRSRSLHNQMLELRSCMQQNIGQQICRATHASQLANLVKGLYLKSKTKDVALLEQIMDYYPTLTASMTRPDYLRTLLTFRRLNQPYYHPRVFEDLITFTKDSYSQLNFTAVLDLVSILAKAGYRPQHFAEFANFTTQVLEEVMQTEDYFSQISLAHSLSLMAIFPDHVLSHIFTFDYLQKVDSSLEEDKDGGDVMRRMMMELNRSVILECPHLDVPWFHQHFCQNMMETSATKDLRRNMVMAEEVEGTLQEMMSGQECVASCVHSPYFHPIDFEIVLDSTGQPVSRDTVKLLQPEVQGYQRVALMLLGNQQLCTNSAQRQGHYLQDRRHLEILGYRVEEVSRLDWHSMVLGEWHSKVEFVRSKIFPSNSNKQLVGSTASKTSSLHS